MSHGAMAFTVDLKKAIWDKRNKVVPLFSSEPHNLNDETYAVAKFIYLCLAIASSVDITVDEEDEYSDDFVQVATGKLVLRHKFPDVDIRRTLVDFCRCFASGSIAGSALRDWQSVGFIERLVLSLRSFAQCNHH